MVQIRQVALPSDAVMDAKRMFQRMLSGWAMDVLELRRTGMDRPSFRGGRLETARRLTAGQSNVPARG